MNSVPSIVLIGSYAPRQCGIATFTQDLRNALLSARPSWRVSIAAVEQETCHLHPEEVRHVVDEQQRSDYARLGAELNASDTDMVCLQHEYGIFGGPDGAWILDTLRALRVPVVTTCHTILATPSPGQRLVLGEIARFSAGMVVMAERARCLLMEVYGVPSEKISVIPHGIPDTDPASIQRDAVRETLDWTRRKIILTTGLLSPNKGIQHVISAMPRIVAAHPDAMYVVAGATHPNLVRREGEGCRDALKELATELAVMEHVSFINRFAARDELVRMIVAADLFVTPYLCEGQITSGVLAYASGLGKPVISTPYAHARELIDDRRGVLVPFASADAIADAAISLFNDEGRLQRMSIAACEAGRLATWRNTGCRYMELFDHVNACGAASELRPTPVHLPLDHLHRLTGPLGIYQHAKYREPDLAHGYCTDDNARALILACDLQRAGHPDRGSLMRLERHYFGFVSEAFDRSIGRFRNFRSIDGSWLESYGSEDSHGRAMWALGHIALHAEEPALRNEAARLFHQALPIVDLFSSPRAWAFTLLGLASFMNPVADDMQMRLAERLLELHQHTAGTRWRWFEDVLSYDNARLPQALLVTAAQIDDDRMRHVALDSLAWLMQHQQAPERHFRPIGSDGFFRRGDHAPALWDQQPLEAHATIAACMEAHRLTGEPEWVAHARSAFAWFEGSNDLGLPVGGFETGACFDGVQNGGLNLNCGAESTLAFLQSRADLHRLPGAMDDAPALSKPVAGASVKLAAHHP